MRKTIDDEFNNKELLEAINTMELKEEEIKRHFFQLKVTNNGIMISANFTRTSLIMFIAAIISIVTLIKKFLIPVFT